MDKKIDCYIFGAGKWGAGLYKKLICDPYYHLRGFLDNNPDRKGELYHGLPVYMPGEVADKSVLVIIATAYFRIILSQLKEHGFTNVTTCFLCGDWETDTDYSFLLYDADTRNVFQNCVLDVDKAKKIRKDYTFNYISTDNNGTGKCKSKSEKKTQKTVLFIAYFFPPIGGSGVQRSVKFVKYLSCMGYRVVVLTTGRYFDSDNPKDVSLLQEIPDEAEIVRVDEKYAVYDQMDQTERQEIYNLFLGVLYDSSWFQDFISATTDNAQLVPALAYEHYIWVNECLKQAEALIDFTDIDIIYTTASPFSDFMLGYYLKQKYKIPWVMDYRDAWASDDEIWNLYRRTWGNDLRYQMCALEQETLKAADGVVAVQDCVLEAVRGRYGIEGVLTKQIVNGYDEDDFQGLYDKNQVDNFGNKVFIICHNGDIYGTRDLGILIDILTNLIDAKAIDRKHVKVIVNGKIETVQYQEIQKKDIYGLCDQRGRQSHLLSLRAARNADLLLLLLQKGESGRTVFTGKLFEYLRLGVSILSFSVHGSAAEKVIMETCTGRNFDYGEKREAATYIQKRYQDWLQGQTEYQPDYQQIKKYSREAEASQLADVFEQCLTGGKS